jgi:TatD DNase family protein
VTPDDVAPDRFSRADPPPPDADAPGRTPLIDSHAHLDMLEDVDHVLARMPEHGVAEVVTIGVDRGSSRWAARTAAARANVWATVGLHPHDAQDFTDALGEELEMLAAADRVVGVGEAGLDYYYDRSPRDVQRRVFAWHVGLAHRSGRALVIHCRDAFEDVFTILGLEGLPAKGVVFHCWSGGPAEAERALALGCVLSFAGTVTFRNAERLREAARLAPLDRILVETDAPFLTPAPFRGKRNEPAYVRTTAEALAGVKDVPVDDLAGATTATASAVFGLRTAP